MDATDKKAKQWAAAMRSKGHEPFMNDEGEKDESLNFFHMESGYHNGPGCKKCGWECCWHCDDIGSIPDCM